MTPPTDAFEAGLRIAEVLERQGVSYALGGALAYGQYGIARATNDVDANVFVPEDGLASVFSALRAAVVTGSLALVPAVDAAELCKNRRGGLLARDVRRRVAYYQAQAAKKPPRAAPSDDALR